MLDKNKLIELGLKHKFLNWVEHETPPTYFPRDIGAWLDEREEHMEYPDALQLYNLLCEIYKTVDIT
jgi:hypothetical protein